MTDHEKLIEKAAQAAYSETASDFSYLSDSLREHWRNVARRVINFWAPHAEPDTATALRIAAMQSRGNTALVSMFGPKAPKVTAWLEAEADLLESEQCEHTRDVEIGERIARSSLGLLLQNREHAAALGKAAREAVKETLDA